MIFSFLGFCFPWFVPFFASMSSSNQTVDLHPSNLDEVDEHHEESIPSSFICCVCLDLLYKPIVLECGHVSCFWCVHKSMDPFRESHCPICRNPYCHFPTICELLHCLLLKMYPIAYKRREKQILEEEKEMGTFSPDLYCLELRSMDKSIPQGVHLLSDMLSTSSSVVEDKKCSKVDSDGSDSAKENNLPAIVHDRTSRKVSSADLLCPACQQFFFRPAVLNCGHVFCEACLQVPEDGVIICKVCEIPHPNDYPNICLELNSFLEEQFPEEYAVRKENVELMLSRFQHKNPFSGSGSGSKKSARKECRDNDDGYQQWRELRSKVHPGAGCDHCGVYPIVGDRYRCQDCVEAVGFDLCGDCYNTRSKRPGRFNQQHTPDHRFELFKPPGMARDLVLRLVGGYLVDSSGAPVVALSTLEESLDGWVAVESDAAVQNGFDDAVVPEGIHNNDLLDNTHDNSIPVEVSHSPRTSTTNFNIGSIPLQHDQSMEQKEEDPHSTS